MLLQNHASANSFYHSSHCFTLGSNPKQTIKLFSFIVKFVLRLSLCCEKYEKKQKEARFGQFKKLIRF